ncbi:hypothetical protein DPMN_191950 [Dreissena polymorpha]|uniref:Uncharacterized protein n=1 Tax=Dreissena polymorpha TaxID=45954 RepID=A0A9D3Y2J4_DREPO|nr:hypothetical protein DPMN_191950 [Dreissena polymorpha]
MVVIAEMQDSSLNHGRHRGTARQQRKPWSLSWNSKLQRKPWSLSPNFKTEAYTMVVLAIYKFKSAIRT